MMKGRKFDLQERLIAYAGIVRLSEQLPETKAGRHTWILGVPSWITGFTGFKICWAAVSSSNHPQANIMDVAPLTFYGLGDGMNFGGGDGFDILFKTISVLSRINDNKKQVEFGYAVYSPEENRMTRI